MLEDHHWLICAQRGYCSTQDAKLRTLHVDLDEVYRIVNQMVDRVRLDLDYFDLRGVRIVMLSDAYLCE